MITIIFSGEKEQKMKIETLPSFSDPAASSQESLKILQNIESTKQVPQVQALKLGSSCRNPNYHQYQYELTTKYHKGVEYPKIKER